ncbi:MAG: right-handed parallel beta-helix repeat-containing protein, partial [Sphingobacteriales bacterium]
MIRRSFIKITAATGVLTGIGSTLSAAAVTENKRGAQGSGVMAAGMLAASAYTTKNANGELTQLFVDPKGSDTNPGTKDRPVKTITRARDMVLELNNLPEVGNICVWLAGGEYRLSETLVFGLADAAKQDKTITYAAAPGQKPVISSDVPVNGWRKLNTTPKGLPKNARGKVWVADIPRTVKGIKMLFNANGILPRAKTGAIAHQRKSDDWSSTNVYHTTIPFNKDTVDTLFTPSGAEITVIGAAPWTMNILPVKYVDVNTGIVYLDARSTYALAEPRYYLGPESIWVENTFAGLNSPGKWLFDKDANLLYYWPADGIKPGNDIVYPSLVEFIRIEGEINYDGPEDRPVQGLIFKGLTFTHGNRFESAGGTGLGLQHDWERFDAPTAMLRFRGAENCVVENCSFINSGGAGIRFDLHAQNNSVIDNEMANLGGVGVLLAGYGPGTKDVNKNNRISNNHIHHIGLSWWHSPGIWAWQSGLNYIVHNNVHDVPYTAIAVTGRIGWDKNGVAECSRTVRWKETGDFTGSESWEEREQFLHARRNFIEHNDIHRVMQVMHDGNGIYVSGTGAGNKVKGNFIHDTPSMAAGEGIRCDDDQNDVLIENNVIWKFGTHGIGICSKGRNHIINNIVVLPPARVNRGMLSLEATAKEMAGSRILHNIFYADQPSQPFVYHGGIKQCVDCMNIDKNIYYNASDPAAANGY